MMQDRNHSSGTYRDQLFSISLSVAMACQVTLHRAKILRRFTTRAHQTLVHMMKTMLIAAGFPPSLKMQALKMAAYVRNRCYHETIKDTPFRMMFGKKPDMHRIKKFGSIAYVHKSAGPARRKMDENCRIGFLAGYREGQAGYDVYFPRERVVQRVEHAHFNEDIVFKDRYSDEYEPAAAEWIDSLEYEALEPTDESDVEEKNSVEDTMEDPDELPPARAADPLDPDLMDYDELDEVPDVVMDEVQDYDADTEGRNDESSYPVFPIQTCRPATDLEKQSLDDNEDLEEKAPPDPALLAEVEGGQEEGDHEEELVEETSVEPEEDATSEPEPEEGPSPNPSECTRWSAAARSSE